MGFIVGEGREGHTSSTTTTASSAERHLGLCSQNAKFPDAHLFFLVRDIHSRSGSVNTSCVRSGQWTLARVAMFATCWCLAAAISTTLAFAVDHGKEAHGQLRQPTGPGTGGDARTHILERDQRQGLWRSGRRHNRRRASASEGHCSSDRGRSGAASPCGHLSRQRNPQHPFCCGHVGKGTSCKPVWGVPIPAGVGQQPRLQTVTPMRIARGWFHAHMPL